MLYLVALLVLAVILYGPSLWIQHTYKKYSKTLPDCPGTGGELAKHLLERAEIGNVHVICGKDTDYYDLNKRQVVLAKSSFYGKSITAIAVAAHESAHAMQHHFGYPALLISARWSGIIDHIQRLTMQLMLIISSAASLALHAPFYRFLFIVGLAIALIKVLLNFATLPAELDASFKRALPILSQGYLPEKYLRPAKILLTAAALTYVAKALSDVINIFKWFFLFKR